MNYQSISKALLSAIGGALLFGFGLIVFLIVFAVFAG